MKKVIILFITIYQKYFSPETGIFPKMFFLSRPTCKFYPSCSSYAKEALHNHGTIAGIFLSTKRIIKCHPWQEPSIDMCPVIK